MTETPKAARVVRAAPGRRLIAAGLIRRFGGHTLTVRVTEAGVTSSLRTTGRDDVFLLAEAAGVVTSR